MVVLHKIKNLEKIEEWDDKDYAYAYASLFYSTLRQLESVIEQLDLHFSVNIKNASPLKMKEIIYEVKKFVLEARHQDDLIGPY